MAPGQSCREQGFDVVVERGQLGFKGHRGPHGAYLADVLADHAIEFIRRYRNRSWYAYLSHPSIPNQANPEFDPKAEKEAVRKALTAGWD